MSSNEHLFRESDRIIDFAELTHMIRISKAHLYRLEHRGEFPQRIKIGQRRVGWSFNEVNQWVEEQKSNRLGSNNR